MVTLKRKYSDDKTTGILTMPDGFEIETLERQWLDNAVNVSCIPEGQYKFVRDKHGRFQWWRLLDVPNRTNIEIHQGSKIEHSQGCILMDANGLLAMLEFFDDESKTYILEVTS